MIFNISNKKYISDFCLKQFDHIWMVNKFKRGKFSALNNSTVLEILSSYMPIERIKIVHGPFGKPMLLPIDGYRVHLSLSHSNDVLVMAISRDDEIGIDLERIKQRRFMPRIAARYFGKEKSLRNNIDFYRSWTSRESFIKATGSTLGKSLSRIHTLPIKKNLLIGIDGKMSHQVEFFDLYKYMLLAICRPQSSDKKIVFFTA